MNLQMILNDIKTLPPDKQEEVVDFIAFLKSRFGIRKEKASAANAATESDSFFGMWRDRAEMADSSSWVRDLRYREWESRNV
jgi:hypothetical protein